MVPVDRRLIKFGARGRINRRHRFEFLDAFYNFYFIIEDCFSGGKTSEKEVLKEFGKSEEFQKILESTHRIFLENKRKEHLLTLESLMSKEGCEWTPARVMS